MTEAALLADASDFSWVRGHAHMALGGLLHVARRPAEAALHFRTPIDLYERKGVLPSVDQARSLLAALAVETGSTTA